MDWRMAMGDLSIADDIIDGVKSALADVGETSVITIISDQVVDVDNPGATPDQTQTDIPLEAFLFEYDEHYMPGTSVEQGKTLCLLDLSTLTDEQIASISIGNYLSDGTTQYTINNTNPIVVAGKTVTTILQLGV